MYIDKLYPIRQYRKMQENGENNDKLNMLNDSIIICSPTPKPTRKKNGPVTQKGKQIQRLKSRLKTYYESPLKHIQKSSFRTELLNIEKKILKKSQKTQQLEQAANTLLPLEDFERQDSVIILSDNESETCEMHNNNELNKVQDSSCYVISDDEKSSNVSDTDDETEEPLPQSSKQNGTRSHNADDIMVVWDNGKSIAKKEDSPNVPTPSCTQEPVKLKKRKRDPGTPKKKGTPLNTRQGKKGKTKNGTIKLGKNKGKEGQQSSGNKNKRNSERKNKENKSWEENNSETETNSEEPVSKKAKKGSSQSNEKEENTLSFVPKYNVTLPRFHCSQKRLSVGGQGPKFITYTRIDYQEGCSDILTASQPHESPHKPGELRQIIIDGSNVAMLYTNNQRFSERGVELLTRHFRRAGHTVKVFIPHYRRSNNYPVLEKLYSEGVVVFTPSRYIAGKRITPYDDRYILQYATMCGGIVVSADQYRDLYDEKPEWRETIAKRLLIPTFVGDYVMLPEDPLGRGGPKLYDFLRH